MKVGFIGLGNMGGPMARRLRAAGYDLVVMDAAPNVASTFIEAGGDMRDTPKAVGDVAEIVFCSLPTPQIVKNVLLGENGLANGEAVQIIVDLSTTGPIAAVEIADAIAKRGKTMLDAPVSGGVVGAQQGSVSIMASGAIETFERVKPLLGAIGRVFFIGESAGQGQAMKLLNNILAANSVAATTEVVALGVKAGLDPNTMIEVLNVSSGQNSATKDKYPRSILNRTFNYGFRTELVLKDVRLGQEFARKLGVNLRIADAVLDTWSLAEPEFAQADYTNIVKVLEREAGVIIGREQEA